MTNHDLLPDSRPLVDLPALADVATRSGSVWTHQGDDLNVNLLVLAAGDGVGAHINAEVDVLVLGVQGQGTIEVDGSSHPCTPGQAIIIPKGSRRAIRAGSERVAYLTCHRRRAGLWPTVRSRGKRTSDDDWSRRDGDHALRHPLGQGERRSHRRPWLEGIMHGDQRILGMG